MSPARFCREFKATFGETFLECLSRQRITAAKRLLANPNMSGDRCRGTSRFHGSVLLHPRIPQAAREQPLGVPCSGAD